MTQENFNMFVEYIVNAVQKCAEQFRGLLEPDDYAEDFEHYEEPVCSVRADPGPPDPETVKSPYKDKSKHRGKTHNPRFSYVDSPSPRCRQVIGSKRSLTTIIAEAYANGGDETGGILLGHMDGADWYLVESTGPGYDAMHTPTRHEMNNRFVNYVYRTTAHLYRDMPTLIGFWHRHPGTFNRFSDLDDVVNTKYVAAVGNGTLSFLVNFTPEPQLTCYYLDPDDWCYHPVHLIVDNKTLNTKGYLAYATPDELCGRAAYMQENMAGVA